MQLKPFTKNISTKAEHAAALRAIAALVDKGDATTREETAYLDLLGTLVEDYERRSSAASPPCSNPAKTKRPC